MDNSGIILDKGCEVEGCDSEWYCKSFCRIHYVRNKKNGDPLFCNREMSYLSFGRQKEIIDFLFRNRTIDHNGCWIWGKYKNQLGYGYLAVDSVGRIVSRVAMVVFRGFDIESKLLVCHHCDNPPCFNPDHLFVGTNGDNVRDMYAKGRGRPPIGERAGSGTLTEKKVLEIRALLSDGCVQDRIAEKYGVAQSTINKINLRYTWKHI